MKRISFIILVAGMLTGLAACSEPETTYDAKAVSGAKDEVPGVMKSVGLYR